MGFKRQQTTIQPADLNGLTPAEAERKIIDGVKKYATHEDNWSKADRNTPFLGQIIGMGIESSNLADITMSVERQFLTKLTKRATLPDGSVKLEAGELGPLRLLAGQDATTATPGLVIKLLMDLGHMPRNEEYLKGVASFAHTVVIGDAYKLNEALRKAMGKLEKGEARGPEAEANLAALMERAKETLAQLGDLGALAASRKAAWEKEKKLHDDLKAELAALEGKAKEAAASPESVGPLRSAQAELTTRLKMTAMKLAVAEEVARDAGKRTPVEEERALAVRRILSESLAAASRVKEGLRAGHAPKP